MFCRNCGREQVVDLEANILKRHLAIGILLFVSDAFL